MATPLVSTPKRVRENGWARMEAGTVMREQEGKEIGGECGWKKRQDEREEPRGLSREGVSCWYTPPQSRGRQKGGGK